MNGEKTNATQEFINQIDNNYFTEEELDSLIAFAKELSSDRT